MPERVVRADSCCGGGEVADTGFDERVALGDRRRVLVRRVLLGTSALSAVAALAVTVAGVAPGLADRLSWAAAIWAAGLAFGWVRQLVAQRRVDWRLALIVVAVVVGVVWQPLVAALVAVTLLAEQVLRPRPAGTPTSGSVSAQLAGQAG